MSDVTPLFDVTPFLTQDEGQHFDRKSLFHGPPEQKRQRDRRELRDQVAEYVAAFANAEGGVLILGIEDDREVTGHALPADALASLLAVPQARLLPAQPAGFTVRHGDHELIVFDVPSADVEVQVTGDGFPLRVGDQVIQASEAQIRNLKLQGMVESYESRQSTMRLEDLDRELLARAREGSGLARLSDEDYLLKRKLADRRGSGLVLRHAAVLLFAQHGPDHPNAGVRVFRVVGTERRTGAEHNVEERQRVEGNLPEVWETALREVGGLLRQPSRLVGNRFKQVSEYPRFSWQEALLNAIAHRDYGVQGACTEVWLFDDRMEVTSPGGLVPGLSIQELLSLRRVHCSRNPRIMRALVDLGLARDQGEGIPRMFAEMADAFLPQPEIESTARGVTVQLRNTTTLTESDHDFVSRIGEEDLSEEEFRALLCAHRAGRVDNASLRDLSGLDTLAASMVLRRLRDRGLLDLHPAGAQSYYTLAQRLNGPSRGPTALLMEDGRPPPTADGKQLLIEGTDQVTNQVTDEVKQVLEALSEAGKELPRGELQEAMGLRNPGHFRSSYLQPALSSGLVAMTRPETPNSRLQAYFLTDLGRRVLRALQEGDA